MTAPTPAPELAAAALAGMRTAEFPFAESAIYLNAAAVAPVPERARRAMADFNRRRSRVHELTESDFVAPLARCRSAAARLIGADPEEIALGGNTSFGINLAARCLPLPAGSCVVTSDREFPANVYPWMGLTHKGVRLDLVPSDELGRPDEQRILERLGQGDVSVLALSAVQFATGFRARLDTLGQACRERGIFFVVDAIQAIGQAPVDVRAANIDILATGGHKWLCGPFGTGWAYVRRELHSLLEPHVVGWTAMRASQNLSSLLDYRWEFEPDARRFEVATMPLQDFLGLAHSMELLVEVGIPAIQAHLQTLLDPLIAWAEGREGVEPISDSTPEHRSGIVCFRPPKPEAAFRALGEAGIVCALREGAIRISPHLYNIPEDTARVIEVLDGLPE